jgi:hypothetical protein
MTRVLLVSIAALVGCINTPVPFEAEVAQLPVVEADAGSRDSAPGPSCRTAPLNGGGDWVICRDGIVRIFDVDGVLDHCYGQDHRTLVTCPGADPTVTPTTIRTASGYIGVDAGVQPVAVDSGRHPVEVDCAKPVPASEDAKPCIVEEGATCLTACVQWQHSSWEIRRDNECNLLMNSSLEFVSYLCQVGTVPANCSVVSSTTNTEGAGTLRACCRI